MVSEQSNALKLDKFYSSREKDFVELHDQVQTSVKLLDSLETFLSTFQKDLSAVSGQISKLQDRSNDIDNRLKSRRKIEKPLSSLIADIAIPPSIATIILDTDVGEPWIDIIDDFERKLDACKVRAQVKAARDVGEVAEGLRIVAASKTRSFFLALFQPIHKSVTTNMQVIQTSVILKYRPLFAFLQRQAPDVAHEVKRSYVISARVYYETGFRRYVRSLGWVKARSAQKFELITSSEQKTTSIDFERLAYGKIDGPSVTLAYMADDKTYTEPIEALLRSLLLVFMDNATAEYTFIKTFFPLQTPRHPDLESTLSPAFSPIDNNSYAGSELGGLRTPVPPSISAQLASLKEEQAATDAIWKQIFDPVLEYVQNFVRSALEPVPSIIPLLTMIRLIEDVAAEIENRACPAAVTFMFGIRMDLWPVFQKVMSENIDGVKKLAEGGSSSYFSRATALTESTVINLCNHYIVIFNSFVALTEQSNETMIFSNLLRLRQELAKMIQRYVNQISDNIVKATAQSSMYETLLQGLSKGNLFAAHPKSQLELAYWSNLEEEARRKIISAQQAKQRR